MTCPFHGARFDVTTTGVALRGPAILPLEVYVVRVTGRIGRIDVELGA